MTEWFQRQFGDQAEFAVRVSLGTDPHPAGDVLRDATWGSLEIWTRGRCLTSSVSDGAVSFGVRWTLLPVFEWLLDVAIRLVNEDPYPRFSKGRDVRDGTAWYDATLSPPVLDPEAERRWFLRRSEWRHHHALRRAAEDVALPNVVFRRLGDDLEVSWDNDAWSPPRPDLRFVEPRGRELVRAAVAATALRQMLTEVLGAVAERTGHTRLRALADRAAALDASPTDWRWLVHRPTAEVIRTEMPLLRRHLEEAAEQGRTDLYVPHTAETHVLRHVRLERREEVEAVLRLAGLLPSRPLDAALRALVRPGPAANERPWDQGNEYAEFVREALGWGADPLPDLKAWMESHGVGVPTVDRGLPSSVAVFSERTEDARALVHVNPRASRARRETGLATALGHVLLDDGPVSVDGDWEHWPTSARARAFGVALTLPEEGVRELLDGARSIGVDEVRAVMQHFRGGPWATTFRLKNLGIITPDEQMELAEALSR